MKKRLFALLLALAMMLGVMSGCKSGGNEETPSETASQPGEEAADSDAQVEDTSVTITDEMRADPVAYITDGAIHLDDTVMTVNGIDVPAGVFFYMLSSQYFNASSFYVNYGLELDLTQPTESGKSMADFLKDRAQQETVRYMLLQHNGEELKLELTDAQKEQMEAIGKYIDENYALFYTSNQEYIHFINQASMYAGSMRDYYFSENGSEAPTEQTLRDYAQEHGNYTCRYILLRTDDIDDSDTEGKASQQAKAQELYDQLKDYSGEELEAKFAELQAEFNADGNTDPYTFDENSSLVEGFREKLAELKPGELGLTDETGYGYFVLLRLDTDLDQAREWYISSRLGAMMDQWIDEADVTTSDVLNALDTLSCLEKIKGIQDAVMKEISTQADAQTAPPLEEDPEEAAEQGQ